AARRPAHRSARAPDRGRLGRARGGRRGPADPDLRTARADRPALRAADAPVRARRRLPHRGAGMSTPLPLRRRFALLAILLGLLLGGLAAVAVLAVAEDYEYVLANEFLRGQAED